MLVYSAIPGKFHCMWRPCFLRYEALEGKLSETPEKISEEGPPKPLLLLVDDEKAHLESLERIFQRAGYGVITAENGEKAIECLRMHPIAVVLTDLVMPRTDGFSVLKAAQTLRPQALVVLMTAYGTVDNALSAIRQGAWDFVTKPIKRNGLLTCIERALRHRQLQMENRNLKARLHAVAPEGGLVGHSDKMRQLKATLEQVAPSSATVLILGESGTGKELCAREIHRHSNRSQGPFVAVNCAALPDTILEAELFGHEKGAFTGAEMQKVGRFERANGGTLLLDEVGDIPMAMQVKLLRVLQENEVERLGGQGPIPIDVRVLAATNVDLKAKIKDGLFREDLYYRLDVITLQLPPLRERLDDVPLLLPLLLNRFNEKHRKEIRGFSDEALNLLLNWAYPGNVRELENAVERAVVLCAEEQIQIAHLPPPMQEQVGGAEVFHAPAPTNGLVFQPGMTMEQLERAAIDATLKHANGDKNLAAQLLGISLRTLYRRLGEGQA